MTQLDIITGTPDVAWDSAETSLPTLLLGFGYKCNSESPTSLGFPTVLYSTSSLKERGVSEPCTILTICSPDGLAYELRISMVD